MVKTVKDIVMACFRVDEEKSLKYQKYKTVKGFQKAIGKVIKELEPDYISVRVIRDFDLQRLVISEDELEKHGWLSGGKRLKEEEE